jgi:cryptochrome
MRQLRQEGWIHHLGRHAVACFLTRGGCYISWERGAEVFEEWLIDHETASNAGNWQWLSCSAFYSQFYRCYSPVAFPQKWDKDGDFVRRYVPELQNMDKKFIYEPCKAPIADQKKAGVRIQGNGENNQEGVYPKPMFDFGERRTICLDGMKKAYQVGLYGNDPKVTDGTWRELFDDKGEGPTEGKTFEDAMAGWVGNANKVRDGPISGDDNDGAVTEDESGARETEDDSQGGDKIGVKRKGDQKTLDGLVKRVKR